MYPPTYLCELQFHLISIERLPGDKSVSIFGLQPASLPLPYYRELILCALRRFQVLRKIFGSDLYAACEGNIVPGSSMVLSAFCFPGMSLKYFFFSSNLLSKGSLCTKVVILFYRYFLVCLPLTLLLDHIHICMSTHNGNLFF